MADRVTIETSKSFIAFWLKLHPTIQENKVTKQVAIHAWRAGAKEEKKKILEVINDFGK